MLSSGCSISVEPAALAAAAETTTDTDYDELGQLLQASELAPTPGEAHGMLCGFICGAAVDAERAWLEQLLPPAAGTQLPAAPSQSGSDGGLQSLPESATAAALRVALGTLARETRERFVDSELGLALLLPGEDRPLAERAAALCDWVRGFLYAIGMLGVAERDLSAQTREVLRDFTNITRMDVDAVADDEESEAALTELTEFVWVAAMLLGEDRADARRGGR